MPNDAATTQKENQRTIARLCTGTIAVGVVALLVVPAATAVTPRQWTSAVAIGILAGGAASLLGALFGFLFGVPPSVNAPRENRGQKSARDNSAGSDHEQQDSGGSDDPSHRAASAALDAENTSLTQIADWLTKVIVGAGLVQLGTLVNWIGEVGARVGRGITGCTPPCGENAAVLGVGVVVYYFIAGFLTTYIHTRTLLAQLFAVSRRDINSILDVQQRKIEETESRVATVEQVTRDVTGRLDRQAVVSAALSNVMYQLYQEPPGGFENALASADSFLADSENEPTALMWIYKAFALGQKYRYRQEHGAPADELATIREATLEAIKKALEYDGSQKAFIRSFWDRTDQYFREGEDDLVVFGDDPEFAQLLKN